MSESYLSGAELIEQIQKSPYSRDLIGYHGQPPEVKWPNNAKVAVQFVLNYEEGGENILNTVTKVQSSFIRDYWRCKLPSQTYVDGLYVRIWFTCWFWRIHSEFQRRKLPMTIFGVAMALVRNPYIVEAIKQADYDVVSHGYRWLHYQETDLEVENSIWNKLYLF